MKLCTDIVNMAHMWKCSCVHSGTISKVNNDSLCYRTVVPMLQHCLHMGYSHTNHSLNHNAHPLPNLNLSWWINAAAMSGPWHYNTTKWFLPWFGIHSSDTRWFKSNLSLWSINMVEKLVVSVFECMLNSEWCMCCMVLTSWIFSLLSSYLSAQHSFCSIFTYLLISILRLCGRRSWLLVNSWFCIH